MSETLSNVLNKDLIFTAIASSFKMTAQAIPIIPTAGTVTHITYTASALTGRDVNSNVVWTLNVTSVNVSAAYFQASIARINDNTGWVLTSSSTGSTYYIGILNFTTGAITSTATVASNPNTNGGFALNTAYFYGLSGQYYNFRKLLNGNLAIGQDGALRYFEFTTTGALITDTTTALAQGFCYTDDESCCAKTILQNATSNDLLTMNVIDKYGSQKSSNTIRYSKISPPAALAYIWAFGNYAICPTASNAGYNYIFLKSEIDKLIKRAVLETGGRIS